MILKPQPASESLEELVKTQVVGSQPQSCWFSKSRMGLRISISNKFLEDADAADQGLYFENHFCR